MKNSYGCLLVAICVIAAIIGVAKPIFFIVPVAIIVGVIIYEINLKKKNALALDCTNSVNEEIIAKNSEKLLGIFSEMTQKYKSDSKVVFENTYDHFLSTAFSSDFPNKKEVLSYYKENLERAFFFSHTKNYIIQCLENLSSIEHPTNEDFNDFDKILAYFNDDEGIQNYAREKLGNTKKNVLDRFLNKLAAIEYPTSEDFNHIEELLSYLNVSPYIQDYANTKLTQIKRNVVDRLIGTLSNMAQPTDEDFNYADEMMSSLNFPQHLRDYADTKLSRIKKIADLHKNGLRPLDIHNPVTAKKDCFYYGKIDILKNRQKDGQKFFEQDKSGEIYILNDEIDIIADGHKKIKMSEIISMDFAGGILQLTILNRQTPLGLSSEDMEYIVEILNMIK